MATKIIFETNYVIPFDNFLANIWNIDLWMKLPTPEKGIIEEWQSITHKTHIPDYEFKWVFLDIKWSYWLIKSLTIKHLLYIYYHHIFNIPIYSYVKQKWIWQDINETAIIYNEYSKNNRNWYKIHCYTKDEDNLQELKKVLKKFTPNKEYDRKQIENNPELTLRTDEIFEYFSTISKNERKIENDNIKSRLLKEAGIENISDELLIQQMNIVENFLSNILK